MTEICFICGHGKETHRAGCQIDSNFKILPHCNHTECWEKKKAFHTFQLDNLSFIEKLAGEKHLL